MANQLSLTVGQTTITVPIKLDNVKLRAVIRRYALYKGINMQDRTEIQIAEAVLRSLLRTVADGSQDMQRIELEAGLRASIEEQLKADNDIADPSV